MHWFFTLVTWLGLAGLNSQEIPAQDEAECNTIRERILARWEGEKLPDGFGYAIGECQYGEGVEKAD